MTRERTIPTKYTDPQTLSENDIILYAFDDTDLGSVTLSGRVCKVMTDPTTDDLLVRVKSGAYANVSTNQFAAII